MCLQKGSWVLPKQLWCEGHGVGRGLFQTKGRSSFLAIDIQKEVNRDPPVPFLAGIGISMIHQLLELLRCEAVQRMSLGNDIADELMVPLTIAYLVNVHGGAVEAR